MSYFQQFKIVTKFFKSKFKPSKHYHDKFRILFVGRLDYEKGINILLESFLKLYDKIKEVELWFCGPTRSGKKLVIYLNYLSTKYPITYGISSVFLALVAGVAASLLRRRISKWKSQRMNKPAMY